MELKQRHSDLLCDRSDPSRETLNIQLLFMISRASVFSLLKLTIYQFVGEGKVVLADCSGQMCINELEEDIEDDIALKSIFINDLLLIYNKTSPQQFAAKASYQGVNNCNYGNIVFPPPDILFVPQRATEFSLQV